MKINHEDLVKARQKRKEFYWLSLLTIPTILMAIVSMWITDSITRTLTQVIIFFFQAIIVKGIIDDSR